MTSNDLLLASLGACGRFQFSPVQIQKLLFLIERNIGDKVGGPHFVFKPYDYGPFDSSIYALLREMQEKGLVEPTPSAGTWNYYSLTPSGLIESEKVTSSVDQTSLNYIKKASHFVRNVSFTDLVASIYKAYPEMRVNSVFKG